MKRTVLVHHHIFKNAGTSFNYALKQHYGNQFLEYDLPGGQVVTAEQLRAFILAHPECRAVSGHHIAMPTPQGESFETLSSVLLRRPLARVRSIYEFERQQQAGTEGAVMAKQLGFREFVLWRLETNPIVFCNYQTYYCARLKSGSGRPRINEDTLAVAIDNLSNAAIVGIVERYDESVRLAQEILRRFEPNVTLVPAQLNVTAKKGVKSDEVIRAELVEVLGEDVVESLERLNRYDGELYAWAETRLQKENNRFVESLALGSKL
jgi:hypothetical protein